MNRTITSWTVQIDGLTVHYPTAWPVSVAKVHSVFAFASPIAHRPRGPSRQLILRKPPAVRATGIQPWRTDTLAVEHIHDTTRASEICPS
jgi:hypothetical protein